MSNKFLLASCMLAFFSLLLLSVAAILIAGYLNGSSLSDSETSFLYIEGGIACFGDAIAIFAFVREFKLYNRKKRLKMIAKDEAEDKDFDRSISFGNDRCKFYFDTSNNQVMIMRVTTGGINKQFIKDFEFGGEELCRHSEPYFCFYDSKNRKLLTGTHEGNTPIFSIKDILNEDKNKDIISKSEIAPKIARSEITIAIRPSLKTEPIHTLIDERQGLVAIVRKGKVSSIFNYISDTSLQRKTSNKSYVSEKAIGNYLFIMDDFFDILVIVTPSSYEIFNYSDIIEVSYEEDGTKLYSTFGNISNSGVIVGGVLMKGGGTINEVSRESIEVRTMQIKILLRNIRETTCVLDFNDSKLVLNTDNSLYKDYMRNANLAKDTLSVIIDKAKRAKDFSEQKEPQTRPSTKSSIADEIAKLAKLRDEGILTEKEFDAQKAKLLSL